MISYILRFMYPDRTWNDYGFKFEEEIPEEVCVKFVEEFFTANGYEKTSDNTWLCKESNVICNVIHKK